MNIVISGGPCSGKTTLIKQLAAEGFSTLSESALDLMEEHIKCIGLDSFIDWKSNNLLDFQLKIFQLQIERELTLDKHTINILDRGCIDAIAYLHHYNIPIPKHMQRQAQAADYSLIINCTTLSNFNRRVQSGRSENYTNSVEIGVIIASSYQQHGFNLVTLQEASLQSRLSTALELIADARAI